MMSKTIYVAGPMSGYPNLNWDRFDRIAEQLATEGWNVSTPPPSIVRLALTPTGRWASMTTPPVLCVMSKR